MALSVSKLSVLVIFKSNSEPYIHTYTDLPENAIVRLPHPRNGDSQGQETL